MALEEEDDAAGIPEWVVTFGDMMSLLLTFFIMLVSMSEIKKDEKFEAMVESMRQQFGHDTSILSFVPGNKSPRNSNMSSVATQGRAKRKDTMRGGNEVEAITGENLEVQTIRPAKNSTLGGVVYFGEDSTELSEATRQQLRKILPQIIGKPQKIEIRGHTSRKPPNQESGARDHWDLAYARCYATMKFLVEEGVEPDRIRLGAAGASEPIDNGLDAVRRKRNARVEILMWDERVGDLSGADP